MRKKLIAYAKDIARSCTREMVVSQYTYTDPYTNLTKYYVTDGMRVFESREMLPDIPVNAHAKTMTNTIVKFMSKLDDYQLRYKQYDLPSVEELRQGITDLVGRHKDTVVWSKAPEDVCVNCRWLIKAMENLKATVAYVATENSVKEPIFLCEEDDIEAENKVMILPINAPGKEGFWIGRA